jgi:4-carboxymuconolactone decarboxylase
LRPNRSLSASGILQRMAGVRANIARRDTVATEHSKGKTMNPYKKRMKRGFEILEKMGREKTMLDQKELYPELYDLSVGHLFGDIWSRPHLTLRERELITLAANIALARPVGTHSHYRSAQRLGLTKEQIMEVIIHVGHYAGWPALALAQGQFGQVLREDAEKGKEGKKKKAKK